MGKKMTIDCRSYYCVTKEIITREIEGELIIVPMISGVGNLDSEMYSLNKTGKAVWEKLDGKTALEDVINDLAQEFDTSYDQIKKDVLEIMEMFEKMGLIVEK